MKRYQCSKLLKLGPVDGFIIHTPDDRKLIDTHPQTVVRELNRMADRIKQLEAKIKRLDEWEESALEVARESDANFIAKILGAKLGESQRKVIQREVPKLLERIKRLEEAGDKLHWAWMNPFYCAEETIVDNWTRAKESK